MSEAEKPEIHKTPVKKSTSKRTFLTKRRVKTALPLIDAGLAALTGIKPIGPYIKILRMAATMGANAIPDDPDALLTLMREVRLKIKELEHTSNSGRELKILRTQLDVYVDLLLDRVK